MKTENLSIYRIDKKNVGDWWSPPKLYFPFAAQMAMDIRDAAVVPNRAGIYVVGGGGLGNESFRPLLKALLRPDRKFKLVAWGVGADSDIDRGGYVEDSGDFGHLLKYFDGFDEVGTRIYSKNGYQEQASIHWVPCASCMSPLFSELRSIKPKARIGLYDHLRLPVTCPDNDPELLPKSLFGGRSRFRRKSNRGRDIRSKLEYLAGFEFIVTNSYHGVYWATLLGRRAICVPFKNGLFTFRHRPAYLTDNSLSDAMDAAAAYPDALEECRLANIRYYAHLVEKYGDI